MSTVEQMKDAHKRIARGTGWMALVIAKGKLRVADLDDAIQFIESGLKILKRIREEKS